MQTTNTSINKKVKQMRADLGMSQAALGDAIGANRDDIKDIERGRKRVLAATLLKIEQLWRQKFPDKKRQTQNAGR